jgi:single-strand DNA-binding protein
MSNLNKVLLMGRLTRDPELRSTPQGTPVMEVGLAVNRKYYDQNRQSREEVLFVEVTFWSKQAELVAKYLRKGQPIFVEGRLSMDTWETPEGQRRTRHRVVCENFQFIGSRSEREGEPGREFPPGSERPSPQEPVHEVPVGSGAEFEYEAGRGSTRSEGGGNWPAAVSSGASSGGSGGQQVDDSDIPF